MVSDEECGRFWGMTLDVPGWWYVVTGGSIWLKAAQSFSAEDGVRAIFTRAVSR